MSKDNQIFYQRTKVMYIKQLCKMSEFIYKCKKKKNYPLQIGLSQEPLVLPKIIAQISTTPRNKDNSFSIGS